MNAKEINKAMRQYVDDCKETDGIMNLKRFLNDIAAEADEVEADVKCYDCGEDI